MKRKIKIGEIVFTVLFVLVLLFVLSIIVRLAQGKTPTVFGYSMMFVETDSMEPEIPAKSLILVKERDFEKEPPKDREIVCFNSNKVHALITHRVISVGDGYCITQGDNAAGDDGEIAFSQVKFAYVCKLSFLSGFANALRTPAGFIFIVIVPCICVLGLIMFNIFKASTVVAKEEQQSNEDKRVEDIKKQAIEAYIKSQENTENTETVENTDNTDNTESTEN